MESDDFFASEDSGGADGHSDIGLGLGGGDKVLDYLIYEEITKEADLKTKKQPAGCLSILVIILVPLGVCTLWRIF